MAASHLFLFDNAYARRAQKTVNQCISSQLGHMRLKRTTERHLDQDSSDHLSPDICSAATGKTLYKNCRCWFNRGPLPTSICEGMSPLMEDESSIMFAY